LNTQSGQQVKNIFCFPLNSAGWKRYGPVSLPGMQVAPKDSGNPGRGTDGQWEYRECDMANKMTLDLKGVVSPMDLLKCNACLTAMAPGEILEVILADAEVVDNLTMILLRSNDEILYREQTRDSTCIRIRKGPRQYDDTPFQE
jgi:TusA-related sulfurtransferase